MEGGRWEIEDRRWKTETETVTGAGVGRASVTATVTVAASVTVYCGDAPAWWTLYGLEEDFRLQFEAISRLGDREKDVIRELLEGILIKHEADHWRQARHPTTGATAD